MDFLIAVASLKQLAELRLSDFLHDVNFDEAKVSQVFLVPPSPVRVLTLKGLDMACFDFKGTNFCRIISLLFLNIEELYISFFVDVCDGDEYDDFVDEIKSNLGMFPKLRKHKIDVSFE